MKGTLVTKAEFKIVGMTVTCHRSELIVQMPKLWETFNSRINEIHHRANENIRLDIALEKQGEIYTQCVCIEVTENEIQPDGMVVVTIPANKYAVLTHKGPKSSIGDTYSNLFKWLKEDGITPHSSGFHMEFYPESHFTIPQTDHLEFDIYTAIE